MLMPAIPRPLRVRKGSSSTCPAYFPARLLFAGLPDDDFADLDDGREVGVLRDVRQDFVGVRPEARLKSLDRIAEDMTHRDVGRRRARRVARHAFVDGVVPALVAHPALHQWHVPIAVVGMVEPGAGLVRVHHADFDHRALRRAKNGIALAAAERLAGTYHEK